MSTNAVVRVEGLDVELYKHWDGNPEATLEWLEAFNSDFAENRGADLEYKFAQLLRSSVRECAEFNLDDSEYTGWGVNTIDSFAYHYLYILNDDGSVTIDE